MKIKTSPAEIRQEAERIQSYNNSIDLYERVRRNEKFYIGEQWDGVNAPDLDKPVLNILKRVVSYFVSTIVSDDIAAQVSLFGGKADPQTDATLKIITAQFDEVVELAKLKAKNRTIIRDAAVDGDGCLYFYFDADAKLSEGAMGRIEAEVIDNTNVLFGNPQVWEVQRQPYIIISLRRTLEDVREEAKENGVTDDQLNLIYEDGDPNGINTQNEHGKVTLYLKFWKVGGVVHYTKTTQNVVIKPPTELGYRLYPIAWLSWERVKNCFHGQSCITPLIDNQIFINKLFAMSMEHAKRMAFPKIVYDATKIKKWSNRVGEAVAANGPLEDRAAATIGGVDMSAQVLTLIEKTIAHTRDTMGASDASLGNVRTDNASAIIAVQKSTQMPLELQRMDFYQFVEDYFRIILEIMRVDYGLREVTYTDSDGNAQTVTFDFSALDALNLKLNVDIGASAYWSEIMQVQTLDNLYNKQIITDPVTYLESIPEGYIRGKQKLIDKLREQGDLQQQVQMLTEQLAALTGGGGADGLMPGMPNGDAGITGAGALGMALPQSPM